MLDDKDIKKLTSVLATKKDVKEIVNDTVDGLALMVGKGFADVDKRFDRVENILLKQHNDKIEKLEKRMHRLEEALAIK